MAGCFIDELPTRHDRQVDVSDEGGDFKLRDAVFRVDEAIELLQARIHIEGVMGDRLKQLFVVLDGQVAAQQFTHRQQAFFLQTQRFACGVGVVGVFFDGLFLAANAILQLRHEAAVIGQNGLLAVVLTQNGTPALAIGHLVIQQGLELMLRSKGLAACAFQLLLCQIPFVPCLLEHHIQQFSRGHCVYPSEFGGHRGHPLNQGDRRDSESCSLF